MRSNGDIERWDELAEAKRISSLTDERLDQQQRTAGTSSVSRLWFLMNLALREHQTWFKAAGNNPWILLFPFARYLHQGMKINNRTQGVEYKVLSVVEVDYALPHSESIKMPAVLVQGDSPPKQTDRLDFEEDKYIVFRPTQARSNADSSNFDQVPTEEYNATRDTVTYLLTRREPGTIDRAPFGAHRERRPRYRSAQYDENEVTYKLEFFAHVFDNIGQFDFWAQDATRADDLVEYFERFMSLWTGVIEYNGIERILYWSRGLDTLESSWRNDVNTRSLQYYFRTESVDVHLHHLVRGYAVNVITADTIDRAEATGTGAVPITGRFEIEIQQQ